MFLFPCLIYTKILSLKFVLSLLIPKACIILSALLTLLKTAEPDTTSLSLWEEVAHRF